MKNFTFFKIHSFFLLYLPYVTFLEGKEEKK